MRGPMSDHILTINAGSSSLKFALFAAGALDCAAFGQIEGLGTDPNLVVKSGKGERIVTDLLEGLCRAAVGVRAHLEGLLNTNGT